MVLLRLLQVTWSGVRVVIPTLINREEVSPSSPLGQSNRERIYRQAFHLGRHVIGYELDKIHAAIDWLAATQDSSAPIGIVAGSNRPPNYAVRTASALPAPAIP